MLWWRLYVAAGATAVIAELSGARAWFAVALVALMPLLMTVLITSGRRLAAVPGGRRLLAVTLAALALSWLGDCTGPLFLPKVAFFLLAQCCYIAAFWPYRHESVWRRPGPTSLYLIVAALLLVLVVPHAGSLTVPVVGYAVTLVLMATLATGVHRAAGWGGAVFVLSDAILALSHFAGWFDSAHPLSWNLLTYTAAQALLVRGVLCRASGPAVAPHEA